ncbi:TPA: hypothetical protein BOS_4251 [Bos taurus]|nr:TPA: hypothetical protein BOS_4251 [Bos taurus]
MHGGERTPLDSMQRLKEPQKPGSDSRFPPGPKGSASFPVRPEPLSAPEEAAPHKSPPPAAGCPPRANLRPSAHSRGVEVKLSWAAPESRRPPFPRPGPPHLLTRPGHPPRHPAQSAVLADASQPPPQDPHGPCRREAQWLEFFRKMARPKLWLIKMWEHHLRDGTSFLWRRQLPLKNSYVSWLLPYLFGTVPQGYLKGCFPRL